MAHDSSHNHDEIDIGEFLPDATMATRPKRKVRAGRALGHSAIAIIDHFIGITFSLVTLVPPPVWIPSQRVRKAFVTQGCDSRGGEQDMGRGNDIGSSGHWKGVFLPCA